MITSILFLGIWLYYLAKLHVDPPNQHTLPLEVRSVSKLVGLGRNDITVADLVLLDKLELQGRLSPMTVQILDVIRRVVLEDVEEQAGGKQGL